MDINEFDKSCRNHLHNLKGAYIASLERDKGVVPHDDTGVWDNHHAVYADNPINTTSDLANRSWDYSSHFYKEIKPVCDLDAFQSLVDTVYAPEWRLWLEEHEPVRKRWHRYMKAIKCAYPFRAGGRLAEVTFDVLQACEEFDFAFTPDYPQGTGTQENVFYLVRVVPPSANLKAPKNFTEFCKMYDNERG